MTTLKSYKLLSFDVYGTLIDWETGVITALQPLLSTSTTKKEYTNHELLSAYHKLEAAQQRATPDKPYSELLTTVHPQLAAKLGLPEPSAEASKAFGDSIGSWSAFPDTVDALKTLAKHYKLVVLSNVDRASFSRTLSGPLAGVHFDEIITAQDIGSYKPELRNFEVMLRTVESEFGVKREEVLQTAHSQFHDHQPARKVGIKSVWIVRSGGVMGNVDEKEEIWDWRFDTLGDMARAVEEESD